MKRLLNVLLHRTFLILAVSLMMIVPVQAAGQRVMGTKRTLYYGETTQLRVINMPGTITWTSGNTSLATVSNSGLVKAVGNKNGRVTIKASNGKLWATRVMTVRRVHLNYVKKNLRVGDRFNLVLSKGSGRVNWHTSNTGVVYWSSLSSDGSTAHIVAKGPGTATVRATYNGITCSCVFVVRQSPKPAPTPKPKPKPTPAPSPAPSPVPVRYTIRTSSSLERIETAGYTDVTVTGPRSVECNTYTDMLTHHWGNWGTGTKRNTLRVYFTGRRNGTSTVTFKNPKTGASTRMAVIVSGMDSSEEELRDSLKEKIQRKSGNTITDTKVKGGYSCKYSVAFNPGTGKYTFRARIKNDRLVGNIKMVMDKAFNSGNVTYSCTLKPGGEKFTSKTTLVADTYSKEKILTITTKANPDSVSEAVINDSTNSAIDLSMDLWNLLLVEKCQLDLKNIGFGQFTASYS